MDPVLELVHSYRLYKLIVILHSQPNVLFIIESIIYVFAANIGRLVDTLVRLIERLGLPSTTCQYAYLLTYVRLRAHERTTGNQNQMYQLALTTPRYLSLPMISGTPFWGPPGDGGREIMLKYYGTRS